MKPTRNHLVSLLIAVMIVGVQFAWHTTEAQAISASAGTVPTTYLGKKGDTLTSSAKRYGVTIQAVAKLDGIKSTSKILVGQKLRIPSKTPVATPMPLATSVPAATRELPSVLPTGRPNN